MVKIYIYSPAIASQEFNSEQRCQEALVAVKKLDIDAICVHK